MAEIDTAREALRIYADRGNWFYDQELEIMQWVGKDDGPYVAQQALRALNAAQAAQPEGEPR